MATFQFFKLGQNVPLPAHLNGNGAPPTTTEFAMSQESFAPNPNNISFSSSSGSNNKLPYGSGDDEGYSLVFPSLAAFLEWRDKEETSQMVEFVKGDTHGSKADPPRFKDHTKLVCARHSRSGRKKYVKKHPERVRKVPSRKLEGTGCSASISFKTYFDSDEVRASYNSQHSHPIGLENFPFTRRGRKAAVQQEKERPRKYQKKDDSAGSATPSAPPPVQPVASTSYLQPHQMQMQIPPPSQSQPQPQPQPQPQSQAQAQVQMQPHAVPTTGQYVPVPHMPLQQYALQPQQQAQYAYMAPAPGYPMATMDPQLQGHVFNAERWQNMATLFSTIREHSARGFQYPFASLSALDSVLIRLFLEGPVAQTSMPVGANNLPVPVDNQVGASNNNNNRQESVSDGSEDTS